MENEHFERATFLLL